MIKFKDVQNGICKILKDNFAGHSIYIEEVKQGLKRPAFHVNVIPQLSSNSNTYYREQQALVNISYFSDEKTDLQSNAKNYEMANALQNALNCDLKILDRNLNLQELQYETVDRVLHCTFTLVWYNENEVTQAYLNQFMIMDKFKVEFDATQCYEYFVTSQGEVYRATDGGFYVKCTDAEIEMLRDRNKIII